MRRFRVSFEIAATEAHLDRLGLPDRKWIEQQIAQPNASIFRMTNCVVEEVMPEIPVGDIVRGFKLPGWLRWLLNVVKGTKIHAGPVDVVLDQNATVPRTGLDQPHTMKAPKVGR